MSYNFCTKKKGGLTFLEYVGFEGLTERLNVHLQTELRNTKTSERFVQNKSTESPLNIILNPNVHIMHVHDIFNDKEPTKCWFVDAVSLQCTKPLQAFCKEIPGPKILLLPNPLYSTRLAQ